MFSKQFEIILMLALAVISVMLFMGKGDIFLKTKEQQRNTTPEQQKKLGRIVGCFTTLLLIGECSIFFFGHLRFVVIVYAVVVVVAFIGLAIYYKKNV